VQVSLTRKTASTYRHQQTEGKIDRVLQNCLLIWKAKTEYDKLFRIMINQCQKSMCNTWEWKYFTDSHYLKWHCIYIIHIHSY